MHVYMHMEEGMATTPVFLPGESHGQRSLVGYRPQGLKESNTANMTYRSTHICVYTYIHVHTHTFGEPV